MFISLNLQYKKLIHVVNILETVDWDMPKRNAKSSSSSPHRSLQRTRKNSFSGDSARGAPRGSTVEVIALFPQYFKQLTDGPKNS